MLSISLNKCISIHALRVEGDVQRCCGKPVASWISIHALRVEGDREDAFHKVDNTLISIHALRVEGDILLYF